MKAPGTLPTASASPAGLRCYLLYTPRSRSLSTSNLRQVVAARRISVKTGWVGGNISLVALPSVTQSGDDL